MGLFDSLFGAKAPAACSSVTFALDRAGHTYDDGNVGLEPTTLRIGPDDRRVGVIGLNGSGKTTLLKLIDGALAATTGTVTVIAAGDHGTAATPLDPAVKRDRRRIEDLVGRVRREEIPESYYRAASIREAIDQPLKKHKVPESERQAIIGNLFAHFDLAGVAMQPASALDSEKRHQLAIRPRDWTRSVPRMWRAPCSATTSRWCSPRTTWRCSRAPSTRSTACWCSTSTGSSSTAPRPKPPHTTTT